MTIAKKGLFVIAVAIIAVQFIRPARNASPAPDAADSTGSIPVPDDVRHLLQNSCFDCHSNNTRYPWYAEIEPAGWWLAGHIRDGKKELNFDELRAYRPRRQFNKLGQIEKQIVENEMPLPSYLLIHRDAVLSQQQKDLIIGWTRAWRDSLKKEYPPDSLGRPQQRERGSMESG